MPGSGYTKSSNTHKHTVTVSGSLSSPMASSQKLTEYERRRLKNIRRNEEMIAALRIHSKATQLFSTSSKRQRVEAKPNNLSPEEDKPETQTLRSLRTQGMRPEFSDPNLNIMSLAHLGPISMSDAYSGAGFGKELIERISKKPHEEFGDGNSIKGVCENGCGLELGSLSWKQEYIRRFVPGRNRGITNLRFLPCSNVTTIVVRNEIGNVGFWDFNSSVNEGEGETIYLYCPHLAAFQEFQCINIPFQSCSKLTPLMDAKKEVFELMHSSHDSIYSLSQRSDDVVCLYFGEGRGGLNIWDERVRKCSTQWNLHERMINSIDFNSENFNIMAAGSFDGTAAYGI